MYWHHGGMGSWGFLWMMFNALVLWGLLSAGAVVLWRAAQGRSASPDAAQRLLAERFARGEIDDEEYRHRLDLIRHG